MVAGREVLLIVEQTRSGCEHACTLDDICRVLLHIPFADWAGLTTFVLRQPTRKQRLLRPAWGRLFYHANLGEIARPDMSDGPAVMLEAVDCGATIEWSTALQPDDMEELDRLRRDGHTVDRIGRKYSISVTAASVRATQLYRTLLHEIGHWVDYLEKVERPSWHADSDYPTPLDAYFQRPKDEREAFAHRYAERIGTQLRAAGVIPFDRQ